MDLEEVTIMLIIHVDYTNGPYIKYSFQTHEHLYFFIPKSYMFKL
jgi:hypothetical protein